MLTVCYIVSAGDFVSLIVQAVGGAMAATADTPDTLDTGTDIMIAGVSVQVAITLPFLLLFADFHLRHYLRYLCEKKNRDVYEVSKKDSTESKWTKKLMLVSLACAISTLFILVRCIYRVAEMAQGWNGYLATHEVYFAALDGIPISIALAVSHSHCPPFIFPTVVDRSLRSCRSLSYCIRDTCSQTPNSVLTSSTRPKMHTHQVPRHVLARLPSAITLA